LKDDDDDDGQDEVYDNEQKANNDRKLQTNFACQTQQTNGMKGQREKERERERVREGWTVQKRQQLQCCGRIAKGKSLKGLPLECFQKQLNKRTTK